MNLIFNFKNLPGLFWLIYFSFSGMKTQAQLPFSDGFESGDLSKGAWTISGNAQVSNQFPAQGTYCLKGPSTWGVSKKLNSSPASFSFIEFKAKASQTNTTSMIFRIIDSLVHTAAGMFFNNAGNIIAVDGSNSIVIMAYDTGQWYSFKFTMNMATRTYDMFIDGQLKADDFSFSSQAFTTTNIFTWSSIASSGIHWIDDVYLYASSSGFSEKRNENRIEIFPNPVEDFMNITGDRDKQYQVTILNTCGQLVFESQVKGDQKIFNLDKLGKGVYFVKITDEQNRDIIFNKIIKQ